eukprot:5030379-Alexandrium_andersonii.AAC.1
MSASLVGSEMCIRDRRTAECDHDVVIGSLTHTLQSANNTVGKASSPAPCLLYTSDAADDM